MGSEKLVGYPLALLGSFALFSPPVVPSSGAVGGTEGAGGTVLEQIPVGPKPAIAIPASTVSPPAIPPPPGRPSAESAELRALRMDEGTLFPEYGEPRHDRLGSVPPPASCETPDYDLAQSAQLEIPSAGNWLRGLKRPDVAVPRDPKVARYIRYFASTPRGRETFAAWLRRSGSYREIVAAALNRLHLPSDLIAVMFVESGCWPKATSSAGAMGLWQFMPQTARAYGMTVQANYDERRGIWKSTEAALAHLADLHNQFDSWHLALAAYNLGYQQLLTRLQSTRTEDFFTLSKIPEALPRETALYVPKVLAIAVILRNLDYFGFDGVELLPSLSASRLEVPPNTRLSLLARAAGTSVKKLRELNPEILGDSVPDIGSPMYVHLPNHGIARAKTMLPRLLDKDGEESMDLNVASDFDWGRDELDTNWRSRLEQTRPGYAEDSSRSSSERERGVRSKDREGERSSDRSSERSGRSLDRDWEGLERPLDRSSERSGRSLDRDSQKLDRPSDRSSDRTERDRSLPHEADPDPVDPVGLSRPRVSRSEVSLHAERGRALSESGLAHVNSSTTQPRERKDELAYRGEDGRRAPVVPAYYRIKPGDTLSQLAVWFKISLQQLAALNGLNNPSHILAGSRIRIALNGTRRKRD